jgi:cytochrome c peroxidase
MNASGRGARIVAGAALLVAVSLFWHTSARAQTDVTGAASLRALAREVFRPLPTDMATPEHPLTPALVALGRDLFFDPRLSADGTVSCARCHQPALYATDALAKARGVHDKINPRNSPTVLNAGLEVSAHWRGERKDLEDQAMQSFLGPASFGNPDYGTVHDRITAIAGYAPLFRAAFPGVADPVTPANLGRAIGAYERTLVTPAPFDAFLAGDDTALTPAQQAGLKTFMQTGCVACHNGVDVGGGSLRRFGIVENYWQATGSKEIDRGRFDVTHNPADMYVFKVPTLRNVAMTAPYFHDGSVATLPDAVRVMARVQLGKQLEPDAVNGILAFLESLTGKLPADFASAPTLPPDAYK